jgi:hypothetical protein
VPTTSIFGLRYPSPSAAPNVPQDIANLAEDVKAALSDGTRPLTVASVTATGVGAVVRKFRVTTQSNATTTLADDNTLFIPGGANTSWLIQGFFHLTGNSTADYKLAWTVPSGATLRIMNWNSGYSNTAETTASGGAGTAFASDTSLQSMCWTVGHVVFGATPGNLQFQWAQNFASGTTTMDIGSWLRAERCA